MITILLACILVAVLAQSPIGRRIIRAVWILFLLGLCMAWMLLIVLLTDYLVHPR
jgi:uncharacterized membrane protein